MTKYATAQRRRQQIVLVTGPAGAGRSSAIRLLEDMGHEAVDNLPLMLLPRLLVGPAIGRPMAIGIDGRTRGFSAPALLDAIEALRRDPDLHVVLLYLDCRQDILLKRYSETRRRHPLAEGGPLADGIARDRALLHDLANHADVLIDTSDLSPNDLRDAIAHHFTAHGSGEMVVSVQSFSYKRGVPGAVDCVFDCRFLRNPHWQPGLRALDGRDAQVGAHIGQDSNFAPFLARVIDMIEFLLPPYRAEGKSYLSVAFGCTGGQHRSVFMAETVAKRLAHSGLLVSIRHRELERHG